MSFYEIYQDYKEFSFNEFFSSVRDYEVIKALQKEKTEVRDFLVFLSPRAGKYLEDMAQKAHRITLNNFGRAIILYTPMYLSDYCVNQCVYCGFNVKNSMPRKKLTLKEVEREAETIAATGLRHILILTGESRLHSPVSYLTECVKTLKKYFTSISIEVYPLQEEEYRELIECGVDGLTIYQEVYNEVVYHAVHPAGPKRDYRFRLDAPERACRAGMRSINIGALLGLNDWRSEAFFTGLHASYLQDKYTDSEISISLPRIRPHAGGFRPPCLVSDRELVQIMLAFRLFMPRAGINISTRERPELRDHLLPLGVTKMSAGSSTAVGGHTGGNNTGQFEISDSRSVDEIRRMLLSRGYQPVFKDWQEI